ncbi:MAG: class I mannose-6-phosphate isomerase [Sphingobacterium sp.]|uniref:class I mannose-6-phosphate isomerase n=1 Tax=Sphingobacterium sp. JB170 TaxID=1434842 RepID=UPI00097EF7BD|nr:class I mannose-6-phosphate isomerase [Sphingobacterium sp. JB170]SJN48808.1 mannose-6-phosphate isomerase, class I [Sphingobacterium sp. JB170]
MNSKENQRKTNQGVMPQILPAPVAREKGYNLYPSHFLPSGDIFTGYDSLADWMTTHAVVKIDGYVGVNWVTARTALADAFDKRGVRVNWIEMEQFLKSESELDELIAPYLGDADSVWGTNTKLALADLLVIEQLQDVKLDSSFQVNIIVGVGAALAPIQAPLVYLDLPKNELLYRMRAKSITNIGSAKIADDRTMYKRFYFVDWVVLNAHKQTLINEIAIFADTQWDNTLSWALSENIFSAMRKMATSVFRPRPWFDPGVWGGQWMKERFSPLGAEEQNLAWSFEIIAPENGVVFQSDGVLLELSFDTLMFREQQSILGEHATQFGHYFPIRFDFLDTFDGGNLSIQCHPRLSYIQKNFGEKYTQDETYYMLDCKPGAQVYLGFQEDIVAADFRQALEYSVKSNQPVAIEKYVQRFTAAKHQLFLIPSGTVHSAGKDNLVLEISATPYIFTFKMYDWLQKDAQGNPRPINIDHAFHNLDFERKGARVAEEFISVPKLLDQGQGWKVVHLPTHAEHYYDVHRLEFDSSIEVQNDNVCHILMLVEGTCIQVITADGSASEFNYAETFIIPAGARNYRLVNTTNHPVKVIKAFLKSSEQQSGLRDSYVNNQGGDGKD